MIAGVIILALFVILAILPKNFLSDKIKTKKKIQEVVSEKESGKEKKVDNTTEQKNEKKVTTVITERRKPNKFEFLGLLLIVTAVILYTLYAFKYTAALYYGWSGLSYFWLLILVILFGILVLTFTERSLIGMLLIICPIILFGSNTKRVFDVERGGTVEIEIPPPLQKSCFNSISNCNLKPYLLKVNDDEVWYKNGELPKDFKAPEKLYKLTVYVLKNSKKRKGQVSQEFALR